MNVRKHLLLIFRFPFKMGELMQFTKFWQAKTNQAEKTFWLRQSIYLEFHPGPISLWTSSFTKMKENWSKKTPKTKDNPRNVSIEWGLEYYTRNYQNHISRFLVRKLPSQFWTLQSGFRKSSLNCPEFECRPKSALVDSNSWLVQNLDPHCIHRCLKTYFCCTTVKETGCKYRIDEHLKYTFKTKVCLVCFDTSPWLRCFK